MSLNMPILTEHDEQVLLFQWASFASSKYPMLNDMFAIPNGGFRKYKTAVDLKKEGVKAGVSDILLPYSSGGFHGLFIEMKRIKKGQVSEAQKDFINRMKKNGYAAEVCYGFEDARKVILQYLKEGKNEKL